MRKFPFSIFLLTVACAAPDRATGVRSDDRPILDQNTVDTDGLPDLIVDARATQNSWRVKDEFLSASFCSVEEGNITPGMRRVLRFTVTTPNVGNADVFVGSPVKHMDPNSDGDFSDADGMFEFSTCHDHYHFQNYATYRLIDENGKEWRAAKRGFCMLDTDPYNNGTQTQVGTRNYMSCGTRTRDGYQGVSHGWADSYVWQLANSNRPSWSAKSPSPFGSMCLSGLPMNTSASPMFGVVTVKRITVWVPGVIPPS